MNDYNTLPTIAQSDVLTTEEIAVMLRMHPVTVRLKAASGEIPGRQVGKRWKFSRSRIMEWLATPERQ